MIHKQLIESTLVGGSALRKAESDEYLDSEEVGTHVMDCDKLLVKSGRTEKKHECETNCRKSRISSRFRLQTDKQQDHQRT